MDISLILYTSSTVVSIVSFLFVLYYCRFDDKPLLIVLCSFVIVQIFADELPNFLHDINFMLAIVYMLQTKFHIKKEKSKCNYCKFKGK